MKTGIDIAKISRFQKLIDDENFLNRVFTKDEIEHINKNNTAQGKIERIAGKFCAKEAVSKALGGGIGDGVGFSDIEILPNEFGCPKVNLYGGAKILAEKIGLKEIEVSISHDTDYAIANCIII